MTHADFDLKALFEALDQHRKSRAMSWAAVTRDISRFKIGRRRLATSTITGLRNKAICEGDGILQMLLWLRRTPESFVPGVKEASAKRFRLPEVGEEQVLRWDAKALHAALESQRQNKGMTWTEVARQVGAFTPAMLAHLSKGGRVSLPGVMRIVRWLGQPAATFTRASDW